MTTIRLDRQALATAVRSSPEFTSLTNKIASDTRRLAVSVASGKVKRRTGAYVDNFETTVTPITGSPNILARLRLFNTRPEAIIIEEGSRPHIIKATKPHGLLVFPVKGAKVFTRRPVHHPGTKAQHVIRDTLLRIARGLRL